MAKPVDIKEVARQVVKDLGRSDPTNFATTAEQVVRDMGLGDLTADGVIVLRHLTIDVLCERNAELQAELEQVRARRAAAVGIIEEKREEMRRLKERVKATDASYKEHRTRYGLLLAENVELKNRVAVLEGRQGEPTGD